MTKKLTKKDHFNALLNIDAVKENPTLVAFIEHELELLAKKNTSSTGEKKQTAQQKANEEIKKGILECMNPNQYYTITEMQKNFPCCADMSNQRVSSLVRQMIDAGQVIRTEDKKKALFHKA